MKCKKIIAMALTAVMSLSLTACGGAGKGTSESGGGDDGKTYNVGICQQEMENMW